jgi:hypothetical protein
VYFKPLWRDASHLAAVRDDFAAECRASHEAAGIAEVRRKAERSYLEKDFPQSLLFYKKLGDHRLTPLERKRVSFMRRKS